jgi:hypothetical protein
MGWHRTRILKVETAQNRGQECGLWTSGNLEHLQVTIDDKVIHIPREAILELVAGEYISKRISRLEQMTTEDAIREMMDS